MLSKEREYQQKISEGLEKHEIYPFSVIFTQVLPDYADGLLSISTYFREDLEKLLDLLDYKHQCDKSGFFVFWESNTICLSGISLLKIYAEL